MVPSNSSTRTLPKRRSAHYLAPPAGMAWWQFELTLVLVAVAVWAVLNAVQVPNTLHGDLVFTFAIGNWTGLILNLIETLFARRRFPWNWIAYLPVLVLIGISGSYVADAITYWLLGAPGQNLRGQLGTHTSIGTVITLIYGSIFFFINNQRQHLEARNSELQGQVQLGHFNQQLHEAELEQAHEIQVHLLPRETPQLDGFQIACAWQPAQAVSGDYFDVLPLGAGRMGLCIADVSGKGITAALLMANLQASVKAFALESTTPAALCAKLNSVLCGTVAPGKFVTLFYAIIDTQQRRLQYENAGHCLPLIVRGDGSIEMPASYSGVLGLFSHWTYADHELQLATGDCLVLVTDGVLEAANAAEEEFGYQRLIEIVQRYRSQGAHALRKKILEEVSAFCNGQFQDDASLILVTVD